MLAGEEIWCQLFSEPGAGSDLANLSTRAVRDGDEWVVTGQKIWTTFAHIARFGILIARTDAEAPKHQGISYFVCPMDLPGIEIRPIVEMTGAHQFNEVFFDDVRIPAEHLVGDENRGWALAKVTLGNERVSLSEGGALWGLGPAAGDLIDLVRRAGGVADPVLRQRLAALYCEAEVLRLIRLRTVTAAVQGRPPGPEASVRKTLADEHGQHVMSLAKDLAGTAGLLSTGGPSARATARGTTASSSRPRSRSAAAPPRCSATSSPSACSACPTTSTSRRARPGPRPGAASNASVSPNPKNLCEHVDLGPCRSTHERQPTRSTS